MTYCVATKVQDGLVFLSDSRTNAGIDQVSTFRKTTLFQRECECVVVLMSAGNLAITQSVQEILRTAPEESSVLSASNMFEAASRVGAAVRQVYARDDEVFKAMGIDFNCSFILGGQIKGEGCRLFHIYAAGNFIEAQAESPYFQIGEAKYGKPILDRVIEPETSLDDAVKCALISMDSTLKSNISVGLPLDLLVYQVNDLSVKYHVSIAEDDPYFMAVRSGWSERIREAFQTMPPINLESRRYSATS